MRKFLSLVLLLSASALWCEQTLLSRVMGATGAEENMAIINEAHGEENSALVTGIAYHNLAGEELNPDFITKAIGFLEGDYKSSGNPLALGYLGSVLTIRSSYEYNNGDVLKSLSSLEKGLGYIDKSVELDPNNLNIRFLRLINGVEVAESSPLNRDDAIKEDIKFFDTLSNKLTKDDLAQYLYYKARFQILNDDIDEALFSLEKAVTLAPNSENAGLCEELLLEWEE